MTFLRPSFKPRPDRPSYPAKLPGWVVKLAQKIAGMLMKRRDDGGWRRR